MFYKLRLKFILIASVAVAVILTSFVGVINSVRYYQHNNEINTILDILLNSDDQMDQTTLEERLLHNKIPPFIARELGYFGYIIDENGIVASNIYNVKNFSIDDLAEFSKKITMDKKRGIIPFSKNYFAYAVADAQETKVVAVDVSIYIENQNDLLSISLQMYAYSMVFFVVVVSIFSGWAIRPYIINAENQKKFITNAGHELKTPLAIIAANTEMQELIQGETEWSKSTNEQIKRMSNLINRLVTLAKLEEQPDIKLTEINFSEIATKATDDIKTLVTKDGKEFEVDIAPDILVKAEEKSLFELLMILIDNANKYCDENGKVRVKLTKSLNRARLEVSNTYSDGKNVDFNKFFDRFYRGDESHNARISGYGIGLSMAQSLVKVFKGKLLVSYAEDMITFTVIL